MPELQAPNFNSISHELLEDLVTYASVTGLNFFKESFEKQGFTNEAFEAWVSRATGADGRGILMSTAHLRDSNVILERSIRQIVYANTATYAFIHNNGGVISIRVTERARKYFWYMYYATKQVKWRYMALTKKDRLTITIPKRQFLGESATLMRDIDQWAGSEIVRRFNNI
jgi:phage gpG-like protein